MTVPEIFEQLDYGSAAESAAPALDWITGHDGRLGHFIEGRFTRPSKHSFASRNPATGAVLATLSQAVQADVDAAVSAARRAQPRWGKFPGFERAKRLHALASLVQKHGQRLAVLESLDSGRPIRTVREIDLPLVARHFSYHAGLALLMETELPGRVPLGVCGQVIPGRAPLLMLARKIAPALAAGNTVVLKPSELTPLSALLFAEISLEAGLPRGVLNIVTGDGGTGERVVTHEGIHMVAFAGSAAVGRGIRIATGGTGRAVSLDLDGPDCFVVFEDADLDSAAESIVQSIWCRGPTAGHGGAHLLVHQTAANRLHDLLRARMDRLRLGDPLDRGVDMGPLADTDLAARLARLGAHSGGTLHRATAPTPARGSFCPPALLTGIAPDASLLRGPLPGPLLVSLPFRTSDEAAALARSVCHRPAASIWSESASLALDLAPRLETGTVWINAAPRLDPAAPAGHRGESGLGCDGGWEGLRGYTKPARPGKALRPLRPEPAPETPEAGGIDRAARLYIGGRRVPPASGAARPVWGPRGRLLGHAADSGASDLRAAVEAALAVSAWGRSTAPQRAHLLCRIAETLSARAAEFAGRLHDMTGVQARTAAQEVDLAVARLFTYAAWAESGAGAIRSLPEPGAALALSAPLGTIGVLCPDEAPLLGLVSVLAPALAMGNRAVLVASEPYPLSATDFMEVLDSADLPPGVVGILTGAHAALAPLLAADPDLDAVWSFSSTDVSATVDRASAVNLKRTWVNDARSRDWSGPEGEDREFLARASVPRSVWIAYGAGESGLSAAAASAGTA